MIGILQNTCFNPTTADQNVCGLFPTGNIRLDLILQTFTSHLVKLP